MALRFIEGFDWLAPVGNNVDALLQADSGGVVIGPNLSATGRFGIGKALLMSQSNVTGFKLLRVLPSRVEGEFVFGLAVKSPTNGTNGAFFCVYDDRTGQILFYIQPQNNGVWATGCADQQTGRSRPGLWFLNTWHYVQLKATPGLLGRMQLKVDGEIVIDVTGDYTPGVLPSGFDWGFDCYGLYGNGGFSGGSLGLDAWTVDDLYIVDTTGSSPCNDWLGNVRVGVMKPDGAGDSTDLTPVGAVTNWEAAIADFDVSPEDGTYVTTTVVGDYDLYNLETNIPTRTIFGTMMKCFYRQTDAVQLFSQNVLKIGGTEYFGDVRGCAQTYVARDTIWERNPFTDAVWTDTDLAAVQIGPKLAASD